jgi:two-component system, NtrC family, sensor histidine kinase PilS
LLVFVKDEYHARFRLLTLSRLFLATFLLGSLIFFQIRYSIYSFKLAYLYFFLVSVYILSAIYWYQARKRLNQSLFTYLQIGVDIFLVTFLVHLTGGIDSGFSILYHLIIIYSSIILYRRGGYLSASMASIFYGGMLDMQYYNVFFFVRSANFTAMQVLYLVSVNILSFYTVAFLSSYLSERLRKASQELREKSIDFDDLRVLQDHILRSVGSGILTMELTGRISSWNPAAEQITGYSHSEIRQKWQEVFGESIKSLFGHTDDLKERPFHFQGEIKIKDGGRAVLGMTASLLKDDRDAVRGIILVFQDITRLVEMEEQVRRQDRLATVGSLAAGIAHEIRNPLASLSGSIQVLQAELDVQGDNRRLMEIVLRETDRLNAIITEFLEYARPTPAGDEQIVLSSLVDETVTLLRNSREFRETIKIICNLDQYAIVLGDPRRLRQVFWNLLINACQAIPDSGEISVSVEQRSEAGEDMAVITVADTGMGIGQESQKKIFDPFFTTKQGGTGLGLAIVHRIIDEHGGSLTVKSEPEKGSSISIRLPLMSAAGSHDASVRQHPAMP